MAYAVLKLVAVLGGEGIWKWGGGRDLSQALRIYWHRWWRRARGVQ